MAEFSWTFLRRRYLTTTVLLHLVPIGVVMAAGIVATTWTHILLSNNQALVVHTYQVIDTTKDVLIGLDDAETGQRGYLLSGDRQYLAPYNKALERLVRLRMTLKQQISDNTAQMGRVERLNDLMDRKMKELAGSIRLHDQEGRDAAWRQEVATMERGTMDAIRRIIGDITEAEKSLLSLRQIEVDRDEMLIRVVAVVIGLLSFLTRAVVEFFLARREIRASQQPES